jgi:hypothetical protein
VSLLTQDQRITGSVSRSLSLIVELAQKRVTESTGSAILDNAAIAGFSAVQTWNWLAQQRIPSPTPLSGASH